MLAWSLKEAERELPGVPLAREEGAGNCSLPGDFGPSSFPSLSIPTKIKATGIRIDLRTASLGCPVEGPRSILQLAPRIPGSNFRRCERKLFAPETNNFKVPHRYLLAFKGSAATMPRPFLQGRWVAESALGDWEGRSCVPLRALCPRSRFQRPHLRDWAVLVQLRDIALPLPSSNAAPGAQGRFCLE